MYQFQNKQVNIEPLLYARYFLTDDLIFLNQSKNLRSHSWFPFFLSSYSQLNSKPLSAWFTKYNVNLITAQYILCYHLRPCPPLTLHLEDFSSLTLYLLPLLSCPATRMLFKKYKSHCVIHLINILQAVCIMLQIRCNLLETAYKALHDLAPLNISWFCILILSSWLAAFWSH